MESLYTNIVSIKNLGGEVGKILQIRYNLKNSNLLGSINVLNDFLKEMRDDLFVLIEHPYVDKIYRDTYYNYFASKRDDFPRNTIKISFFKSEIKDNDFRDRGKLEKLQGNYLGFLIVRPTFSFVIGRNVISPEAFLNSNFQICRVNYNSTVNGLKFNVFGFPHCSQDQETITCAETTVWSLLEYFGNRYAEYRPSLPSLVNEVLGKFSFERLVPSKGLTAGQISYALRELGFGVKIYSKSAYKDDFERLLKIYVESGIPVVGVVQNNEIGHALNIIGRSKISQTAIDNLIPIKVIGNKVNVFDFSDIDVEYTFIDDNYPPYQSTKLETPSSYYTNSKWAGCKITNFIVPLYPKIYLEAGEARKTALTFVEQLNLIANKDILIKTFLASSRSFKNEIALNNSLNSDVKELILSISMPKFIWIMEISDKKLVMSNLATGMVILDATEPKRFGIIAAMLEDTYIANDLTTFTKINLPLRSFLSYQNNLN